MMIEIGTIIHVRITFPKRYVAYYEYKRWDGKQWVDITDEMKKRKEI